MKNSYHHWLYLFGAIICSVFACRKSGPVTLAVDFTARACWQYRFSCALRGTFARGDTASVMSSSIRCVLYGTGADRTDRLRISADSVVITSNTLDKNEVRHWTERIRQAEYVLGLTPDPAQPFDPQLSAGDDAGLETELCRQLLRLAPSLPEKPVRPGFSWERTKQFPVQTSQGCAMVDMYQSFTFDSLRSNDSRHKLAYIRWRFSYRADAAFFDDDSGIRELPLAGSGSGEAVLDITGRALLRAAMRFETPSSPPGQQMSLVYQEEAELVLLDETGGMPCPER